MSTNPYAPPNEYEWRPHAAPPSALRWPASLLIALSSIWLAILAMGFAFNVFLLATGLSEELEDPPSLGISKETQIAIRMGLSAVLFAANVVILTASIRMLTLRNYSLSMLGAILAVIPCFGPCYLLGVPFGIWALVVLKRPAVKEAFR